MSASEFSFPIPSEPLQTVTDLPYPLIAKGKVREIFDMGDAYLMVATDRLSAFDVIMNEGIAGKGILLTQISLFWFEHAQSLVRHHLVENHSEALEELGREFPELRYRSMIVKKLKPLPIEAVVRGYISGSGWESYSRDGRLFEYTIERDLIESEELPEALFTPTSKANEGHDMPITNVEASKLLGEKIYRQVKDVSLQLYKMGAEKAGKCGIILADTKFEFGTDEEGNVYLIDEILTPDSSRYWPADQYVAGRPQASYDKQFVRDYLNTITWDKTPPPPTLPANVLEGTFSRYAEAYTRLVGSGV